MERRDFIKACCYTTIGVPVLGSALQSCGSIYYANVIKDTNKLIISKSEFVKINNKLIFLYNFLNNFFFYWRNYNERKKEISSIFYNSLMFLNEKIEINTGNNRSIKGIFKGIKYDGSLILDKDNELVSIYSGNIKI